MSETAFFICMLIVGGVALLVFLWIGIDTIIQKRKKKPVEKKDEEYVREQAARKSDSGKEQEEPVFVSHFGITKEVLEILQLVQLKTHSGTVGETVRDALMFYTDIVNIFEPGDQLVLHKAPDMHGLLLKIRSLERIEKKVEG